MAANAVGQSAQAEAQIRCKTTASDSNAATNANTTTTTTTTTSSASANAPANVANGYANATDGITVAPMATSVDPRRQSTVSSISAASPMDTLGMMPNCVVDSHIPHMICKFFFLPSSYFCCIF